MEGVDQRIRGHPGEWWRRRVFEIVLGRPSEKEELPSGAEKSLQTVERARFNANRSNRHEVERFVELGAWEQLLESRGLDFGIAQAQGADGF